MVTHLLIIGANLILAVLAISICLELFTLRQPQAKLAALCTLLIGINGLLNAGSQSGMDWPVAQHYLSQFIQMLALPAMVILLGFRITRKAVADAVLWLMFGVAVIGYVLVLKWVYMAVLIGTFALLVIALRRQNVPGYACYTALLCLLVWLVLPYLSWPPVPYDQVASSLILAMFLHQIYRQYGYRV